MVSACSQVTVHDCGNANVENWGVVVRVRNSVVCVGSMRVASLKREQRGGKTTCILSLNKSVHTTPT